MQALFQDFERWTLEQRWFCYKTTTKDKLTLYLYATPSGKDVSVMVNSEGEVVSFTNYVSSI